MATISPDSLPDIRDFIVSLARKAGTLILEGSDAIQSEQTSVEEKKNSVDLVTQYDVQVEQLVQRELKGKYPTFKL